MKSHRAHEYGVVFKPHSYILTGVMKDEELKLEEIEVSHTPGG